MMKHVWIVTMSHDYEGSEILEVFGSEASALAFAEGYRIKRNDLRWGEAVVSDDITSWRWADRELAVERHEVMS